jgi:hypothetical protein
LFFEQPRQLGGGSGFARAIQPNDQDSPGLIQIERRRVAAEQDRQFIVKNFYDLLPGSDAAQNLFAQSFCFDARDEILCDLKIDVGLEQREPHLAQRAVNIGFADLSMAAQIFENILQLIAE